MLLSRRRIEPLANRIQSNNLNNMKEAMMTCTKVVAKKARIETARSLERTMKRRKLRRETREGSLLPLLPRRDAGRGVTIRIRTKTSLTTMK